MWQKVKECKHHIKQPRLQVAKYTKWTLDIKMTILSTYVKKNITQHWSYKIGILVGLF